MGKEENNDLKEENNDLLDSMEEVERNKKVKDFLELMLILVKSENICGHDNQTNCQKVHKGNTNQNRDQHPERLVDTCEEV